MTPAIRVRPAVFADLTSLRLLYHHLMPNEVGLDRLTTLVTWTQMLAGDGLTVLVAELPDVGYLIGTCTLLVIPNLPHEAKPDGLIEHFVTHTAYRGQGIGAALLTAAKELAWKRGCYRIMMKMVMHDAPTLRLYQRAGFQLSTKQLFELPRPSEAPTTG